MDTTRTGSKKRSGLVSCLIIAEMANAHAGDLQIAKAIVEAAAKAGADAIKFQVFTAAELAVPTFAHYSTYEKLQMPNNAWTDLVQQARSLNLKVYADVFGPESAELMNRLEVDGFMIHAADILNKSLLKRVGCLGRNIILSLAGSNWSEVAEAIFVLKSAGTSSILLMHGFQGYPTALSDSYLNRVRLIRDKFGLPVGFASHIDGDSTEAHLLPVFAACAGASAVEVHITLDRQKKGLDYYSSLEPHQFAHMVDLLRKMESALGPNLLDLTDNEIKYRLGHRKYLVAMKDINPGEVIQEDDLAFKRIDNPPMDPLPNLDRVLGRSSVTLIPQYSPIKLEDLR